MGYAVASWATAKYADTDHYTVNGDACLPSM